VVRPEQVLDFPTLYKQNCTACHGEAGKNGAAIPLANPVYLSIAGEDQIHQIIANGVAGKLMPPFAKSAGGMLTDEQVAALAHGMVATWGKAGVLGGTSPPYAAAQAGDIARGQEAFTTHCARCHGATGEGMQTGASKQGSIVDPSYLALISDQSLRSIILAGLPDRNMPDWRGELAEPPNPSMTDQQVTDIVAWLASHRASNPGQPYPTDSTPPAGAAAATGAAQ
jgi:cytochrome c oxidase cbb3-type subunit 3/ubiquinol-cytochrome c reductase cytochrome c subunit